MYRVTRVKVAPPAFAAADLATPLAAVKERPETAECQERPPQEAYRLGLLTACAAQIEAVKGRLWWPGSAARATSAVIEVDCDRTAYFSSLDPIRIPFLPRHPDTAMTEAERAAATVRHWQSGAWVPLTVGDVDADPLCRWVAARGNGIYDVAAAVSPDPDELPAGAGEALNRLFGWMEAHRPVWSEKEGIPIANFTGALYKSGALAALDAV